MEKSTLLCLIDGKNVTIVGAVRWFYRSIANISIYKVDLFLL